MDDNDRGLAIAKELQGALGRVIDLTQQQQDWIYHLQQESALAGYDRNMLDSFFKKPYILRPIRGDRHELIIPRFINFSAGWPVRVEGEYNVFVVSRFINMITPLPEWMQKELGYEKNNFSVDIGDGTLDITSGNVQDAFYRLGGSKKFSGYRGNTLHIAKRREFEVLRQLARIGILPYKPKRITKEYLRTPTGNVKLRPQQARDFETFLEKGAVAVIADGGAGKTFYGMYAIDNLVGKKLILAKTLSVLQQWKARIELYVPRARHEVEYMTYAALHRREIKTQYTLVIADEIQSMPSDSGVKASQIQSVARIGLTATPWREDGNEDIIPALCGYPVGFDWTTNEKAETTVWILNSISDKNKAIDAILKKPTKGKTMIFVYRLEVGKQIANRLKVPFVSGETKNNIKTMQENDVFVCSKVADAGISLNVTRVIDADFLGGRTELGQRALRTGHADGRSEVHVLMTGPEYKKQSYRLTALTALRFDVKVVGA
jgi:DNA excision repair protein ERCC-3